MTSFNYPPMRGQGFLPRPEVGGPADSATCASGSADDCTFLIRNDRVRVRRGARESVGPTQTRGTDTHDLATDPRARRRRRRRRRRLAHTSHQTFFLRRSSLSHTDARTSANYPILELYDNETANPSNERVREYFHFLFLFFPAYVRNKRVVRRSYILYLYVYQCNRDVDVLSLFIFRIGF